MVVAQDACPTPPQSFCFLSPGAPGHGNVTQPCSDLCELLRVLRSSPLMSLVGQVAWAGASPVRIINCDFAAAWTDIFDANADLGNCFCYSSLLPTLLGRLVFARSLQPLFSREGPVPFTKMWPHSLGFGLERRMWGLSGHRLDKCFLMLSILI